MVPYWLVKQVFNKANYVLKHIAGIIAYNDATTCCFRRFPVWDIIHTTSQYPNAGNVSCIQDVIAVFKARTVVNLSALSARRKAKT